MRNVGWLQNGILIGGGVALVLFVLFWGGLGLNQAPSTGPLESESFFNYIIPKLKKFVPKFTLIGRRFVDKRKLAPKGPHKTDSNGDSKALAGDPAAVNAKGATAQEAKKDSPTDQSKKKKEATSQSPEGTPASDLARQQERSRDSEADLEGDRNKLAERDSLFDENAPSNGALAGGDLSGAAEQQDDPLHPEVQLQEWKNKVLSNPNKETMNELIYAFQTGSISAEVYYQVVESLLKSPGSDLQNLGIYALLATPSYQGLRLLLVNREFLTPESDGIYRTALDSYAQQDRLLILNQALRSSEALVVIGAMNLVVKIGGGLNLWSADYSSQAATTIDSPLGETASSQQGDSAGFQAPAQTANPTSGRPFGRDRRGPTTRFPKDDFILVVRTLNQLKDSSDSLIARAAQETLSQLNYRPSNAALRDY